MNPEKIFNALLFYMILLSQQQQIKSKQVFARIFNMVKGSKQVPKNSQMVLKVFEVFNAVSQGGFHSKANLFDLVSLSRKHPKDFYYGFEQAHLKIFRFIQEGNSKKTSTKFQDFDKAFFSHLIEHGDSIQITTQLLQHFLKFLCQAIHSSILLIRITAGRMLFLVLEVIPPTNSTLLSKSLLQEIAKAVQFLLRTKTFLSRQLGVKLASMLFAFHQNALIERQLFKILATENNQHIRKLVAVNLTITKKNIDNVLVRLRDKSLDIRAVVLRKLTAQHYPMEQLSQSNLFKILYDGYGCKDLVVRQQAYRYFLTCLQSHSYNEFVRMFHPQLLLAHPDVRTVLDALLQQILSNKEESIAYVQKLCEEIKSEKLTHYEDVVWLKNAAIIDMGVFTQECPTASEFARLLLHVMGDSNIVGAYEILQLLPILKMTDEIGRNNMFNALAKVLLQMQCRYIQFDYSRVDEEDDICQIRSAADIEQKKILLYHNEPPIITNTMDLIPIIASVMQSIRPEYFEVEIKQIMAEWTNPQENTLYKEKQIVQTNIHKAQLNNDYPLVQTLLHRYASIQQQIERDFLKTRGILLSLCRTDSTSTLAQYLPLIKEQLKRDNRAYGILMLGYYCLQSLQHTKEYFGVFWKQIHSAQQTIHLLPSIKVSSDLINKFNLLQMDLQLQDYTHDEYLKVVLRLAFSPNPMVKIQIVQSLCMMLFYERVDESNAALCFLHMLLLWWESEQTSTHTVNIISLFLKHYIERSKNHLFKLAQMLLVFFKVFLRAVQEGYGVNRTKLNYKLKNEQFIKKGIAVALTVLKYTKESKQVIWTYGEGELGPQEYFLVEVLRQEGLEAAVEKGLMTVDFYQTAPVEVMLFVKKELTQFDDANSLSKKSTTVVRKYISHIETAISLRNDSPINEEAIAAIQHQSKERAKIIQNQVRRLMKNIKDEELFVLVEESSMEDSENEQSEEEERDSQEDKSSRDKKNQLNKEMESSNLVKEIEKRKPPAIQVISHRTRYRNRQ